MKLLVHTRLFPGICVLFIMCAIPAVSSCQIDQSDAIFKNMQFSIIEQELFYDEVEVELEVLSHDENYDQYGHLSVSYILYERGNYQFPILENTQASALYIHTDAEGNYEEDLTVNIPVNSFIPGERDYSLELILSDPYSDVSLIYRVPLSLEAKLSAAIDTFMKEMVKELRFSEMLVKRNEDELIFIGTAQLNPDDGRPENAQYNTTGVELRLSLCHEGAQYSQDVYALWIPREKYCTIKFALPYTSILVPPGSGTYTYQIAMKSEFMDTFKLVYEDSISFTQPQLRLFHFELSGLNVDVSEMDVNFGLFSSAKHNSGYGLGDLFIRFESPFRVLYDTDYAQNKGNMQAVKGLFQFDPEEMLRIVFMDHDFLRSETIKSLPISDLTPGVHEKVIQNVSEVFSCTLKYSITELDADNFREILHDNQAN